MRRSNPDPSLSLALKLGLQFPFSKWRTDSRTHFSGLVDQLGEFMHGVTGGTEPANPFPVAIINIFIASSSVGKGWLRKDLQSPEEPHEGTLEQLWDDLLTRYGRVL